MNPALKMAILLYIEDFVPSLKYFENRVSQVKDLIVTQLKLTGSSIKRQFVYHDILNDSEKVQKEFKSARSSNLILFCLNS